MRRMFSLRRRRSSDERGVVAVEFALVLPVFIALLFGTFTLGLTLTQANGVSNGVREGARFGATADASVADWTDNVIQQVRETQADDPSSATSICVQLWKVGSGVVLGRSKCSTGNGGPTLTAPASATDLPKVPANSTGCVVRVLASRPFTINTGLASWDRVSTSSAVARFERKDKVSECDTP